MIIKDSKFNKSKLIQNSKFENRNLILYLDTSEEKAVIGIWSAGKFLAKENWEAHRELSKTLSQKYSDILAKVRISNEDLGGIVVFVGPGSFTGLRIGISFANALAYGLNVPIYETKIKGKIDLKVPQKIIVPFYGSEPKITKTKVK